MGTEPANGTPFGSDPFTMTTVVPAEVLAAKRQQRRQGKADRAARVLADAAEAYTSTDDDGVRESLLSVMQEGLNLLAELRCA